MSDDEEEAAVPAIPETWPNGNPMWATDPTSRIQLRMLPIPDQNRVFASLAVSPEVLTDAPSVAQLRALWGAQPRPMRYFDDVCPHSVKQFVENVAHSLTPVMMSQIVIRGLRNRPLSTLLMRFLLTLTTIDRQAILLRRQGDQSRR